MISYLDEGSGPTLVFLHGLGTNKFCWDAQAEAFRRDWRVIRIDIRGFGESPKTGPFSIKGFAAEIVSLLDSLKAWPIVLVGTSMGGYIALTIAMQEQARIRKLVLCHTACSRRVPPDVMAERLAALHAGEMPDYARVAVKHAIAPTASEELRGRVIEMLGKNDKKAFIQIFSGDALDFNLCGQLATLTLPTLIISNEDDKVVPYPRSVELNQGIPNSRLEVIPGTGHLSYMEKPVEFNRVLQAFLKG
jgi:3-oxoadipate enol-lactonase